MRRVCAMEIAVWIVIVGLIGVMAYVSALEASQKKSSVIERSSRLVRFTFILCLVLPLICLSIFIYFVYFF